MSALRIKDTRESDPCSYKVTEAVTVKPRKNYEAPTGSPLRMFSAFT